MNEEIDDDFVKILTALAGSRVEMAFERRGEGTSTYPFHGEILSVDEHAGTIQILRTRTHAGEVHTMGLRYFLSATAPNCEPFLNSLAIDRHKAQLQKSVVRDRAIEVLKADSLGIQSHTLTESRFLSKIGRAHV